MRRPVFTVPFAKVVGPEATELEFGPDDYLVVRPLFGLSKEAIGHWSGRMEAVGEAARAAQSMKPGEKPEAYAKRRAAAEANNDRLILDMLREAVVDWHLEGSSGEPIPMPGTPEALNALPGAIAGSLFDFLSNYRGEGPNPTTPQ